MTALELTPTWDKVFPHSDKVEHSKITFYNRYGIELAADLYMPKHAPKNGRFKALAVAGPFGAVKEQASGLYAQIEGQEPIAMMPGTVVHIPANMKHWHGAAPGSWFSHIAFMVPGEDQSNEWLEPVNEDDYNKLD